jgi:hypothetical protein
MHRILAYIAFTWLTLAGTLHFAVDVVAQYARGRRVPGPETTLYYGLNTAYALGLVLFGLLGLLVARRAIGLFRAWSARLVCGAAAIGWFAVALRFIEYPQPRFMMAAFGVLLFAAVTAHGSGTNRPDNVCGSSAPQ